MNGDMGSGSGPSSPQPGRKAAKPTSAPGVNLLPEIPPQGSVRKLTSREQRDCEVIGNRFHMHIFVYDGIFSVVIENIGLICLIFGSFSIKDVSLIPSLSCIVFGLHSASNHSQT